jgi:uncharacterized MAPEG superfamily protein
MTTELTMLAWTLVLAVALAVAQIFLAGSFRTMATGLSFNMGARDGATPPPRPLTARLQRAQATLFETLPLFAIAVLIAHVAGLHSSQTVLGCELYLAARVLDVPLYAAGVPIVRSLAWAVSIGGIIMLFKAILVG